MIKNEDFNKGAKIGLSNLKRTQLIDQILDDIPAAVAGAQAGLEYSELIRLNRNRKFSKEESYLSKSRKMCFQIESSLLVQLNSKEPNKERIDKMHADLTAILYGQKVIIERIEAKIQNENEQEDF